MSKKGPDEVARIIREYFIEHPQEEVRPGPLTRHVEAERGLPPGDQSAGQVRHVIGKLMESGDVVRLPGSPLRYRNAAPRKPPGRLQKATAPAARAAYEALGPAVAVIWRAHGALLRLRVRLAGYVRWVSQ